MRTIETALVALKQTLYCPDCGHIWQRNVPPRPPSEAWTGTLPPHPNGWATPTLLDPERTIQPSILTRGYRSDAL